MTTLCMAPAGVCPQFAAYWSAFQDSAVTCPITLDLVESWSRGRPAYAVWLIRVNDEAVSARMQCVRTILAPYLRSDDLREPHITLAAGGFPCATADHSDDFSEEMFAAQLNRLADGCFSPFEVEVLGAGSFSATAFLEVQDTEGRLRALHNSLNTWSDAPYVPHITFGHYAEVIDAPAVVARLAPLRSLPPLRVPITSLSLATYDVSSICGPLTEVCRFDLASGRLTWLRPFLMGYAAAGSTRQ